MTEENKHKYQRTLHVPWSPGKTKDDKTMKGLSCFEGREVVVTEKRDGENTTMMRRYMYARSLDSAVHPSQHIVKGQIWAQLKHDIPKNWRICGENLYALHSIPYTDLVSYFEVFSVWNELNNCLSWDNTKEWGELLELQMVPEIWRGIFDEKILREIKLDFKKQEGWVVRCVDEFNYFDFNKNIAKFVRENHVQTDEHWKNKPIVPNKLISD